jgi:hypothetical protein
MSVVPTMRVTVLAWAVVSVVGLAGCGSATSSTVTSASGRTNLGTHVPAANDLVAYGSLTTTTPQGWTETVSRTADGQLTIHLTVTGPINVLGGCLPELTVWLVDSQGNRLPSSTASGVRCFAVAEESIPSGTHRTFSAQVQGPASAVVEVHAAVNIAGGSQLALPPITVVV